jgi:hypothetical protein
LYVDIYDILDEEMQGGAVVVVVRGIVVVVVRGVVVVVLRGFVEVAK